jgi:hypothetical protein
MTDGERLKRMPDRVAEGAGVVYLSGHGTLLPFVHGRRSIECLSHA